MPETVECDICKHTSSKEGSILVKFDETSFTVCNYCLDDMARYVILQLRAENAYKSVQRHWNS